MCDCSVLLGFGLGFLIGSTIMLIAAYLVLRNLDKKY